MTRPILLVDGSNIAYGVGKRCTPILQNLLHVLDELRKFDLHVIVIVDATLRHYIDKPKDLEALINSDKILQAPAGRTADVFLLQLALKRQDKGEPVYILTNDMFPHKEAGGVIPRIAFMIAKIGEDREIVFIPPLESLVEPVHEDALTLPQPKPQLSPARVDFEVIPDIPPELLRTFMNLILTLEPPPEVGYSLPFAMVAGYLHNQFDGNFCHRFGYGKPKEFAHALKDKGYVTLRRDGLPLYLELQPNLLKACKELDTDTGKQPPATSALVTLKGTDAERLQSTIEALQQECHYPTEEKIAVKLHSMFPRETLMAHALIEKGLEKKYLTKEKVGKLTSYWPISGRWDAVDPDDLNDPYPPELYMAFQDALDRLPASQRTAQTRYYLARNLGRVGNPVIGALPQAKREHMIQRAVARNIIIIVRTMMGPRYSVPIRE